MGKFKKDLWTGLKGEHVVQRYLKGLQGIKEVIDVSKEKEFQKADVDIVCVQDDGQIIFVEVKTDTMTEKTGNVVYEVFSNKWYGTEGCFAKTKAKYIFYYLEESEQIYVFFVDKLRKHVADNYNGKKRLIDMGDNAQGYLIKLEELINAEIAFRVQ